jgi:hypothetical protein
MKKILILLITLFSMITLTANASELESTIGEVSAFVQAHPQISDAELDRLTVILQKIILVKDIDDSRETTFTIFNSYHRNKSYYNKAASQLSAEQKKQIREIFNFLEEFKKNGNS